MKFEDLKQQERFLVGDELMMKTGPRTYVSLDNMILGERTMEPFIEERMKSVVRKVAAPPELTPAQKRAELAKKVLEARATLDGLLREVKISDAKIPMAKKKFKPVAKKKSVKKVIKKTKKK